MYRDFLIVPAQTEGHLHVALRDGQILSSYDLHKLYDMVDMVSTCPTMDEYFKRVDNEK